MIDTPAHSRIRLVSLLVNVVTLLMHPISLTALVFVRRYAVRVAATRRAAMPI